MGKFSARRNVSVDAPARSGPIKGKNRRTKMGKKRNNWAKLIGLDSESFRPERIVKRLLIGAGIPLAVKMVDRKLLQGRIYTRFYDPHRPVMCEYLKKHCVRIHQSLTPHADNGFHGMINIHKDENFMNAYDELASGSVFISRNGTIVCMLFPDNNGNHPVYLIGKNFKKDIGTLINIYNRFESGAEHTISVRGLNNGSFNLRVKPEDAIFSDQKNQVFKAVDNVIHKFTVARQFLIAPASAIILHGIPGTGKSLLAKSIVKYIHSHTQFTSSRVVYVTKSEKTGRKLIKKAEGRFVDEDQHINIIVLEDCDMMMQPREEDTTEGKSKRNLTGDLMNVLDNGIPGLMSPLLIIMTTNYIDKIDKAILRPGRTDAVIEVKDISWETAKKMCNFYKVDINELPVVTNDFQNPAKLQQLIIEKLFTRKE